MFVSVRAVSEMAVIDCSFSVMLWEVAIMLVAVY